MGLFPGFTKKDFFSSEEQSRIIESIQQAEKKTSGEIRIYLESKCKYVEPLDRAVEVFYGLKMNETIEKNAVLIYLAYKDHQLAIFADEGIHKKTGVDFWKTEIKTMLAQFNREDYASGIVNVINDIGDALYEHFPFVKDTDKNELPDDIVFG